MLGVDQAIKHVVRLMPEGEPFFRCPPLFELERVTNTGVAFSLFSSRQGIVVLLPAVLMLLRASIRRVKRRFPRLRVWRFPA